MKLAKTLGRDIVGEQNLAAPQRPVLAEPKSIEDDRQHRWRIERNAVLGEATRDVGMMMGDADEQTAILAGTCLAPLRREIIRVSIDGDERRRKAVQFAIVRQHPAIVGVSGRVLEVADVLRDDRAALANKADGRFEFRAHRHHRRRIGKPVAELNGFGRVAAGAAQQSRCA